MEPKERRISDRSLENLKLGAKARYQGKVRQNFTILPDSLEWLKKRGNASSQIDQLVEAAKAGELKSSNTHDTKDEEKLVSNRVYEQKIETLEKQAEELRSQLAFIQEELARREAGSDRALPDLEAVRDRVLSRWKLQRRAESKDRIKEALDRFIGELGS